MRDSKLHMARIGGPLQTLNPPCSEASCQHLKSSLRDTLAICSNTRSSQHNGGNQESDSCHIFNKDLAYNVDLYEIPAKKKENAKMRLAALF